MTDGELCLLCQVNNKRSRLHSYQINLEEAIVLCENPQCSYPVGSTNHCVTYSRSFSHIEVPKPKDVCPTVPEAQVALQNRMARYAKTGAKMLKTVIGTQTDRRPDSRPRKKLSRPVNVLPIPVRNSSVNSPVSSQSYNTSNHSRTVHKLNGLVNGRVQIPSQANIVPHRNDRISPTNSTDSGAKVFTGFSFSARGSEQKPTSKSEPPLGKLKKDMLFNVAQTEELLTKHTVNDHSVSDGSAAEEKSRKGSLSSNSSGISGHTKLKKCKTGHLVKDNSFFRYPSRFIQWRNKDALCWLDAVQCLLVHNRYVQRAVFAEGFDHESILYKLLDAHKQAQELLESIRSDDAVSLFSSKTGAEILPQCSSHCIDNTGSTTFPQTVEMKLVSPDSSVSVKTGAGNIDSVNPVAHSLNGEGTDLSNLTKVSEIDKKMVNIRELVWQTLQPKLKFERGRNDSPVFTMSSLLRESECVEKLFKMSYTFWCQCSKCGYADQESFEKVLPTLPGVVKDFESREPSHTKVCGLCGFSATRTMVYKKLSDCVVMHFTEGLPHNQWEKLDFDHHGNTYTVTGVVQYINNPDHFIAWLRDPTDGRWMRCDDLETQVCTFQSFDTIPPTQIHIVMWEKVQGHQESCQSCLQVDGSVEKTAEKNCLPLMASYSTETKNGLDNINWTAVGTEVKDSEMAQNQDLLHNQDLLSKLNLAGKNCEPSAAKEDSVNVSEASNLPSGRFNVPKESGSSSLSSSCSELSEELPTFAAVLPNLPVIKPIPCHTKVCTGGSICGTVRNPSCCSLTDEFVETLNGKCEQVKKDIMEVHDNDTKHHSSENVAPCDTIFAGQKPEIKPSAVFCVPTSLHLSKPEINKTMTATLKNRYPPYSVQRNITSSGKTDGPNSTNFKPDLKPSTKEDSTQNQQTMNTSSPSMDYQHLGKREVSKSTKNDKFKFISSHRLDRSLFTYMKRSKSNAHTVGNEKFMTLNISEEKRKNRLSSDSNPYTQTISSAAGNVSYLGKVQQYLFNNRIGFGDSKFDGLKLKSNSETCKSEMVTNNENTNGYPNNGTCSARVISPMSEWFGRKLDSPSKSMSSSNDGGVKRKSDENIEQAKKIKTSLTNGDSNGNHTLQQNTLSNVVAASETMKQLMLKKSGFVNKQMDGGQVPLNRFDLPVPANTDCVLQDLYEALNIPFEDVGSTMANIMSDVDDILDFMNPSETIHGQPGTAAAQTSQVTVTEHNRGQLTITNGHC